jgi:hypothetical protein
LTLNPKRVASVVAAVVLALLATTSANASPVIFDDFATGPGHFGYAPTFSSTSNVSTSSTSAYMSTGGGADGNNFMRVTPVMGTPNPARIRWLSGGPPYDTTNGGAPVGNTAFTVTAGAEDGKIGFYFRTTASGITLSLSLDQPANTAATMVGALPQTVTPALADGQWHLFEWDLDLPSDWGVIAGIGGSGANLEGFSHTIDSIYIQGITFPPVTVPPIDFDFVAKTDSDASVATLLPEPAGAAALGLTAALASQVQRRPRRRRD